jgi:hypothetical protein
VEAERKISATSHPSRKDIIIADGSRRFMNLKLIVAILVTTAMPVYAQAQDRNPVVTAARRVVEIISSDPAKVETCCAIGKLGVQIEDANEAKDKKTAKRTMTAHTIAAHSACDRSQRSVKML